MRLLVLWLLLTEVLSFAKRVVFLPYGNSFKPTDRSLHADCILIVAGGDSALIAAERLVEAAGATVVLRELSQLFVRLPPTTRSLPEQEGIRMLPLSAGPFASMDDAIHVLRTWRTNYFGCHRTEDGNSCFEFGGCHQRCWWRTGIGRAEVMCCTVLRADCDDTELLSLLNDSDESHESRRRDRIIGAYGECGDDSNEALKLAATLVGTGVGYYCGIARAA